jgi:thiamine biosynthesis lipoprotein
MRRLGIGYHGILTFMANDLRWIHVRHQRNHMATSFDLRVSCAPERRREAEVALDRAHDLVARLEDELTEFRATSPIQRLNRSPVGKRVPLSAAGIELLERSERPRAVSGGAFDCCAKGTGRVAWDRAAREAWRLDERAHVGFGAIGKGYALDQVRALLERSGFHDFLLSGGGSSILLSGFSGPGEPWSWAWSWSKKGASEARGIEFAHRSGLAVAIGVSGVEEQGRHVLDPRVENRNDPRVENRNDPRVGRGNDPRGAGTKAAGALSALVAHPSATDADALSTALFVAGWEESLARFGSLAVPPAMAFLGNDRVPAWNGTFQELWGPVMRDAENVKQDRPSALSLIGQVTSSVAFAGVFAAALALSSTAGADETVDLGDMGANAFTPYTFERNRWWILLPVFALSLVLVHLRKINRRTVMKKNLSKSASAVVAMVMLWGLIERAGAVEIEPKGKALVALLGTPKVSKKTIDGKDVFFVKDAAGKLSRFAMVDTGLFEPNCQHMWAIGLDGQTGAVIQVRVISMDCPHAFPCKADSFLDQYKGKTPADGPKLKDNIQGVAKATYTADLTTAAVQRTLATFSKVKGQL